MAPHTTVLDTVSSDANTPSLLRPSTRSLIAPTWHTILFIAIFVGLSIAGGFFQHAAKQHPQSAASATPKTGNAISGYMSVLLSEWLLVFYVRMGVHKRGVRLRDLVGGRWATPKEVMKDIALGAALWAVWMGLMNAHVLGGGTNAAQALLPQGILESLAWFPLALSAGFCEELAFRGYLQKQFQALTGNLTVAVLLQSVVFGVAHGYQGWKNVVVITALGLLYGALAAWRGNLRANMISHAWSDFWEGWLKFLLFR